MAKQNVNQVKISDEDLAKIQKAVEDSRPKGYFENLKEICCKLEIDDEPGSFYFEVIS